MDRINDDNLEMNPADIEELEFINRSHINGFLFTNENRAAIVYLLHAQEDMKMQTEKIAYHLGISHRTVLYHLEILEECGFVEVKEFRRHGLFPKRSVWGIAGDCNGMLDCAMDKIVENFGNEKLDEIVSINRKSR